MDSPLPGCSGVRLCPTCGNAPSSPPPSPSRSLFCLGLFFSSVFMCSCLGVFVGDELSARRRQAESLKPAATICLSFSRFITLPLSQAIDSFLHLRHSIASCFHPVKSAEMKMNLFFFSLSLFLLTDLQRICVLTTSECH